MTEAELHLAVAEYLRVALPPEVVATAIQAEGRGAKAGAIMKARGVLAGMPDFVLFAMVDGAPQHFGIELKSRTGRISDAQAATFGRLYSAGFPVLVCRSLAEVESALMRRGIPLRARLDGRPA